MTLNLILQILIPLGFGLLLTYVFLTIYWKKLHLDEFPWKSTIFLFIPVSITGYCCGVVILAFSGIIRDSIQVHGDNPLAVKGLAIGYLLLILLFWLLVFNLYKIKKKQKEKASLDRKD